MHKTKLENGWYCLEKSFFNSEIADNYYKSLLESCEFKTNIIKLFGKKYNTPRAESFHSKSNKHYAYSGNQLSPKVYTSELLEIETKLEAFTQSTFNSVLINLYRNEKDSNGWHADNEKELGLNPLIASVSLGAPRRFELKHLQNQTKIKLLLEHGDLLVMGGALQHYWKHQVPKENHPCLPRINLTYRNIF